MSEEDSQSMAPSTDRGDGNGTATTDRRLRSDGGVRERDALDGVEGAAAFGLAIFGVLAVGAMAMSFLSSLVLDSQFTLGTVYAYGGGTDDPFFAATFVAFSRIVQFGLLLAIVLGVYLAQSADTRNVGAIRSIAANGVGAGLTLVVLSGLLLLTGPGEGQDVVELLKPAAVVTAGTIVAGGGAGYATVALRED